MTPFDTGAIPAEPWKNGVGATRTIAISPDGAGFDDFDWRISIAEVNSSGDFSRFPGVDRTILLLEGPGMELSFANTSINLTRRFEPHAFSGDELVRSRLVGASRDFNVMTRRGRAEADVLVVQSSSRMHIAADAAVFFCGQGSWRVDEMELRCGWALQAERPSREMDFAQQTPDSAMIAVLVKLKYS